MEPANEDTFDPVPDRIKHLVLNEGASRVPRDFEAEKPDELWLGDAYDPAAPEEPAISLYLRLGSPENLVAEAVCGCLARILGLPAPEVFIVHIPPGHLPHSALIKQDAAALCVATKDLGGETFLQFLRSDKKAAISLLTQWADWAKVVAFDEWVANGDRNFGNIIYKDKTLHIIDHAEAFGGACRSLYPLNELADGVFDNRLAIPMEKFTAEQCHHVLEGLSQWLAEVAEPLDIPGIVEYADTSHWQPSQQIQELITFIEQRLGITYELLCNRLGHPQLKLTSTETKDESVAGAQ